MQALWAGVYVITVGLVLVRVREFVQAARADKLLVLLIGLVLMSVLWSDAPAVSVRRSVALMGTTMFGVYLAARFRIGELLQLLAWTFGIAAMLSLFFALALPRYGISFGIHEGAWRGVYGHKNILGRIMTLSAIVFFLRARSGQTFPWASVTGFILSAALVVLSASRTAWTIFLASVAFLLFDKVVRWHRSLASLFLILMGALGAATLWVSFNVGTLLGVAGRDASLTGRTDLWDAVLVSISDRPILGYGYSGFWLGWDGASSVIWQQVGWSPPHAHNGFLDLFLDLGVIGFSIFMLSYLVALVCALRYWRSNTNPLFLWPLMYLLFMFFYNVTESTILRQNNIFWLLYVATVLAVRQEQHLTMARHKRKAPP